MMSAIHFIIKKQSRWSRHMAKMLTTAKSRSWVWTCTEEVSASIWNNWDKRNLREAILETLHVRNEISCTKTQHKIHICFINTIYMPHDLKKFLFFLIILCIHSSTSRIFCLGCHIGFRNLQILEHLQFQISGLGCSAFTGQTVSLTV